MHIRFLKIKAKSLAEEARIIRKEERKTKEWLRDALHKHRVTDVRQEARATYIAYGILRGKKYRQIEPKAKHEPNWQSVVRMLKKYGGPTFYRTSVEDMKRIVTGYINDIDEVKT